MYLPYWVSNTKPVPNSDLCWNFPSKPKYILIFTDFQTGSVSFWGRSENTFHLLQWLSMRKQILKHKNLYKEGIYHKNNIAYDLTCVGTFTVDSGMPLIFTDFQHSTCCRPVFSELCSGCLCILTLKSILVKLFGLFLTVRSLIFQMVNYLFNYKSSLDGKIKLGRPFLNPSLFCVFTRNLSVFKHFAYTVYILSPAIH